MGELAQSDVQQLRGEIASMGKSLEEIKTLMTKVLDAVQIDHQKLEELEATSRSDHKMIRELEKTRRDLEVTGRIQVGRSPVGL